MYMKKKLVLFVYLFAYLISLFMLFRFSNNIYFNLIIIVVSILGIDGLSLIFRNFFFKMMNISDRFDKCLLVFVSLLVVIFSLIFSDIDFIVLFLNILSLILGNFLVYQYARRMVTKQTGLFALSLSSIVTGYLVYTQINSMLLSTCVLPLLMLYILEGFDYDALFRRKNLFRIFIVISCIILLSIFNWYGLIVLLGIMFEIYKKGGWKTSVLIGITFFISIIFGISISVLLGYSLTNNNIFSNIDKIIYIVGLMLVLSTIMRVCFSRYHNLIFNHKFLFIYIFSLVLFMFMNVSFENIVFILFLFVIFIAINIYNFPLIYFNFSKYKLPQKIKKVSVVIPNYNYAHYISKRINSILKQNYPVYELIILDDCSKDNSEEVILEEIDKIKNGKYNIKVKYIPNKDNSGNVFKQWQKAFEVSTGDYLWIAEADDLCSKYFLNVVMKKFDDPDVIISYTESNAIDENGKIFKSNLRDWIDIYDTGKWDNSYVVDGKNELMETLCINNTIANVSSVVFRKNVNIDYKKYLKESQKFVLAGDWYFYSKVLLHGKIAYDRSSFNYHRMHSGSVTTTTDNFVHYQEIFGIQESIMRDVEVPLNVKERIEERRFNLRRQFCISDDELLYEKISWDKIISEKKLDDEVLLSIIIPVYNVENYINKCLKSVFKNLPPRTEVIVINDGSPDDSEKIILDYVDKHSELRYYKKENGGLSSVKNMGLKLARGKYIIYLDSDDYVSSNMYDTMLKKAIFEDADFVYSDVIMEYEDGSIKYVCMRNFEQNDELMQILDGSLMAASWNKMILKELYEGLEFPEGLNNEDVAVTPIVLLRSKKRLHILSPFYKYLQRSGSIQNSGFSEKRFMVFKTAKICFDRMDKWDFISQEKVIGAIVNHQLLAILIYLISSIKDKEERLMYISEFCDEMKTLDIEIDNNHYIIEYLKEYKMISLLKYLNDKDVIKIDKLITRRKLW